MSGILLTVREKILSGNSCMKLFIVSCIFASIHVSSTSTSVIWVTLHMPSAAEECREPSGKCQGTSHCLESGQPVYTDYWCRVCSIKCSILRCLTVYETIIKPLSKCWCCLSVRLFVRLSPVTCSAAGGGGLLCRPFRLVNLKGCLWRLNSTSNWVASL